MGELFWSHIKNWNLLSNTPNFEYAGVNPCAEEPLPAGGSCLLGSLNLAAFVNNGEIDYDSLAEAVFTATVALNEVLDEGLALHPLKEQQQSVSDWRQIGLGIFGCADMFIKMGIRYGSEESIELCHYLSNFILNYSLLASSTLAMSKGTYKYYNYECVSGTEFYKQNVWENTDKAIKQYGLRNSQLLTIAPTGSISTMLGVSGGVEPIFANYYERKTQSLHGEDVYYKVYTPIVKKYMEDNGIEDDKDLPDFFITSQKIPPIERVKFQAAWQSSIDASISSTVNLPEETTVEEIEDIYMKAWEYKLKGITVFRDKCKRAGVLITEPKKTTPTKTEPSVQPQRGEVITVSDDLIGKKRKVISGCVDKDTEYFNGKEWKKISEYKEGEQVLQYNPNGTVELVQPLTYIKNPTQGFYHFKTKYGLDMMVSKEHRNVVFMKSGKYKILTTEEILNIHNKNIAGFTNRFKLAFDYNGKGINLTDDEIRISVAIFADGCFYSETSRKCVVSVRKERKYNRLIELLERAGIEYVTRYDNQSYYNVKFYPPIPGKVKTFPTEWYNCSKHQMEVILDELFNWDGYAKAKNEYTTTIKSNADFIQFVCASLGMRGSIYTDARHDNLCYRVDWSKRAYASISEFPKKEIPFVSSEDGYEYCFSVPSTMLVLRRNNRIFITGNCGSLHIMAYFDPYCGDLREVYLSKGSEGGCASFMNGLSRMISIAARAGVAIGDITDQLNSCVTCPSYAVRKATKKDTSKGNCCPAAVAYALKDMWTEMREEIKNDRVVENIMASSPIVTENKQPKVENSNQLTKCPECGEPVEHIGGCVSCPSCGWSKCG